MSPDRGRRGTPGKGGGKGGAKSGRGPAAVRRLGLMIFGAVFVVLFAIVAISEGIGDPSVPSGDVVLVEDVPGDAGAISEADFEHALELAAKQGGEKAAPKPGDPKYEEVKDAALNSLLEAAWLQGLAAQWDIEVTDQEIAKELKKVKRESFKSEAEFQQFLKQSGYTPADVDEQVKLRILSQELQEQLKEKAPTPTGDEIEAYYEAAKTTQFTQKPTRDVRLIVNKDSQKAEEARDAVIKDNSAANWKEVAQKYSEDPTTKASGGLQKGVQEGILEEPLDQDIFAASQGRIEGPVKAPRGYVVFEVVTSTPETVQELKAVGSQIESTLAQQLEQEYFASFAANFNNEWKQRTFCVSDFTTERCANFEPSGPPPTTPPGCLEEDPKGGIPAACPAPVNQLIPAMPGTITPLQPKGQQLAQRPRPLEEPGAGTEEPAGLPGGAVPPPTGAPPTE